MSSPTCDYHPNVAAVDRCERCRRKICLNDKRTFRQSRSSGTGDHHHTWTESYTYCVPCNTDAIVNANTGFVSIMFSIFIIGFGILFAVMASGFTPVFSLFGLFFAGIGIYQIATGPGIAEAAREEERKFLNSLDSDTKGIKKLGEYNRFSAYSPMKTKPLAELTCFQCGDRIPMNAQFCMNCGEPTADEKKEYRKYH